MSEILVDVTSQSADTPSAGFTEVADLVDTVVVPSGGVVLILAVVPLGQEDTSDEGADFRFAIDDVLDGPEITAYKDQIDEGCGVALCFAITGLSGSTKFALQWRIRRATPIVDTGRVRSLQVIHITDASLLTDISSVSSQAATPGYDNVANLSDTKTPASADSILVLLANMVGALASLDNTASFQFTVAGTGVGPESKAFEDEVDEGCGMSQVWCLTGQSGSTAFALQWDELQNGMVTDTGRERTFQIIEITANAEILTAVTSVAADALTDSFTDVVDLVDTVTVQNTDSILLFFATLPLLQDTDKCAAFRVFEGGIGEGPEQYVFSDDFFGDLEEACGHSLYHAVTGKSTGSHTFSIRGQNVQAGVIVNLSTLLRRSLVILELKAAQVDKEAIDTLGLEVNETLTDLLARMDRLDDLGIDLGEETDLESQAVAQDDLDLEVNEGVTDLLGRSSVQDDVDLAIVESPADVAAGITASDILDLAITEGITELLGLIEPVDTTGLSVEEVAEILALAARLDTLDVSISEVTDLLGILNRTDLLDLAIEEGPGEVAAAVTVEDDLDLDLIEDAELLALIQVADALNIDLGTAAALLVLVSAEDTLGISISEVSDLLGILSRTDLVDLSIDEILAEIAVGVETSDTLDLEINESVADLLGIIQPVDTTGLSVGEIVEILALMQRLDTLDINLTEVADLLALIEASDTVALTIVEGVTVLFVQVDPSDLLDIDLGEVSDLVIFEAVEKVAFDTLDLAVVEGVTQITNQITATDILDLSISEVAELVGLLNRFDTLDIDLGEPRQLQVFIEAVDNLGIELLDATELVGIIQAADSLDISIGEVAGIVNALFVVDVLGIDLAEGVSEIIEAGFQGIIFQPITLQVRREAQFTLETTKEVKFTLQIEGV